MAADRRRLTVLRHELNRWEEHGEETVGTVDRLKEVLAAGPLVPQLFRYDEARILTHRVEAIGRPLKLGLMLRLLSRGRCYVEGEDGRRRRLTLALLVRWAWQAMREPFQRAGLLSRIAASAATLEEEAQKRRRSRAPLRLRLSPVYVRTDLSWGLKAGGSVGHTAGVLNHLDEFTGPPVMLTTDVVPTIKPGIEIHPVASAEAFWEYPELPSFVMNWQFERLAERVLADREIAFVYHRYSINSFAGARIAVARGVPLVLEYNGSEVWICRHWGTPLENEAVSEQVELANLRVADLIVVVSQVMADELVGRGVPRSKVLVNPNGVEPDRYSPSIDGSAVRRELGLEGKAVIGFIGTFGAWHGAEVLAEAFGRMITRHPRYRDRVRLLMIGDGVRMPDVKRALEAAGVRDLAVLTGTVAQADGPRYLAACDVLASPHVPNADGTPFFGSPTKLFEYMAMGKGIVASDLDQIGDILEHGRAARMVEPGNVDSLAEGLEDLVDHPERAAALGAEARRLAVERHTWREHTRRIIARLQELVPAT